MPVPKKRTISQPDLAKGESAEEKMPEEQEFRQHLRALAVSAVRVLIEKVMCEELEQCVGAQWGESVRRIGSYEIPAECRRGGE
jgi:putative transposase